MALRLCQIQYGTTPLLVKRILFSISGRQEVSVKSKKHFFEIRTSGIQIQVDSMVDDGVHPVLDSLDNYKLLSERMNVLTIYLPFRKLPVASTYVNLFQRGCRN